MAPLSVALLKRHERLSHRPLTATNDTTTDTQATLTAAPLLAATINHTGTQATPTNSGVMSDKHVHKKKVKEPEVPPMKAKMPISIYDSRPKRKRSGRSSKPH